MSNAPAKSSGSGTIVLAVVLVVLGIGFLGVVFCGAVGFFFVVPTMNTARSGARDAAMRMQSRNNMKMIGLALHNYHDVYNCLPAPHWTDKDGNRMHSWRAALLPFLEQNALYDQYDFNVAWDDPLNVNVTQTDLEAFHSPRDSAQLPTVSNYLMLTGEGAVMEPNKWTKFADITDGLSNTVIMVEVLGSSTSWAEPADLEADSYQLPADGVWALFADGSVQELSGLTAEQLAALISRAGNEQVNVP